jgi:uncharacterized membrane protein YtjA (UPF0391 family)
MRSRRLLGIVDPDWTQLRFPFGNFPTSIGLSCRERLGYRPFDCSLSLRSKGYGKDFMLHYAIVFLIIALIAAFFGFAGVAGTSAWIAQLLFGIFLVLFVISLVFRGRPPV